MKILIVDDDPAVRHAAAMGLARLGCVEVLEAANGVVALARAVTERPDLILLDVDMPVADGPTTLGWLRANARTASIPIALFAREAEREALSSLHAVAVVSKALDPGGLVDRLLELLVERGDRPHGGSDDEQDALRVLITDDDEDTRDLFGCALRGTFEVRTAESGDAALRLVPEWRPDVVVVDILMPNMAGHLVARELRRPERGLAVPRLLGFSGGEVTAEQRAPFDAFLQKPVKPRELVRRVVDLVVCRWEPGPLQTDPPPVRVTLPPNSGYKVLPG